MPAERLEADYIVETAYDPRQAAEAMAGEQSSGTFVAIPGESPELKERAAARVEALELIDEVLSPSLPGAGRPKGGTERPVQRVRVTLSWPVGNVNDSLPNVLATVAGNLFELKQLSGLRLTDLRLPSSFARAYRGPKFGIDGTRRLSGVARGPLIGTIIKPSIGLSADETASLVRELCEAGIDFIKDDELQADAAHCPFDERVRKVMAVIRDCAEKTGRQPMYAFNLTGDLDQMRRRHDLVHKESGTCIMASMHAVGLVGMIDLARHSELPIHAHRNGWGYFTRHPMLGFDYAAWQKIWRLAGADHLHVNGIGNKFSESDESVVRSARAVVAPLFPDKPALAMPVFSSGQTVRQAEATYAATGHADLIFAAGGGVMAHPGGPAQGVRSLREAWEAAMAGIPAAIHARTHPALAAALETFR